MMARLLRNLLVVLGVITAALLAVLVIPAYWSWATHFSSGLGPVSTDLSEDSRDASVLAFSIENDSGIAVRARLIVPARYDPPLRPILILGGHETGSRAVELVGPQPGVAIMALDYPVDGVVEADGLWELLELLPRVRTAALDTPVAISSAITWIEAQDWSEPGSVELVGVSLGVPFAATAAAFDERVAELWLVHGASDNLAWLHHNVARRIGEGWSARILAQIFYWVLCAPNFDTPSRLQGVSPRPVTIIGAREDQRTPPSEVVELHRRAPEPKRLLWTEGGHVDPGRLDTIRELLDLISRP